MRWVRRDLILKRKMPHVFDEVFFEEQCPYSNDEKDAKSQAEGKDWNDVRPVIVDDSFEHNLLKFGLWIAECGISK